MKIIKDIYKFNQLPKGEMYLLYSYESKPYIKQAEKLKHRLKNQKTTVIKFLESSFQCNNYLCNCTPEKIYENLDNIISKEINNLEERTI